VAAKLRTSFAGPGGQNARELMAVGGGRAGGKRCQEPGKGVRNRLQAGNNEYNGS